MQTIKKTVTTSVTTITATVVLAACTIPGTSNPPAAAAPECGILDVSGSTVRARGLYPAEFAKQAQSVADRRGTLCLLVAGGDPIGESSPLTHTFRAEHEGNSLRAPAEIRDQVSSVTDQFAQLTKNPPVTEFSSGLVEAAVAIGRLNPTRVTYFSDGVQHSDVLDLQTADLSAGGIQRILDNLAGRDLLPEGLAGAEIRFVLPGYGGPGGSGLSAERQQQIRAFWEAWARRIEASLVWG